MFYCDDCKEDAGWPMSYSLSYGKCECCGSVGINNDVPSQYLNWISDAAEKKIALRIARNHIGATALAEDPE